jgi:hypothetical protein
MLDVRCFKRGSPTQAANSMMAESAEDCGECRWWWSERKRQRRSSWASTSLARCGGCLAAAQSVRHGAPPCLCPRSRPAAGTMAAGAVLGVMASDLQAHLFASLLNGHTADVSLVVRGAAWEGVYRLHRVVLIQAVRSISLRGWSLLIIGDPGHIGFLPVALPELRVLRNSSSLSRPGRD